MEVLGSGNLVPLLATFGNRVEEELTSACHAAVHYRVHPCEEVMRIGEKEHQNLNINLKIFVARGDDGSGLEQFVDGIRRQLDIDCFDSIVLEHADLAEPGEAAQKALSAWAAVEHLVMEKHWVRTAGLGKIHLEVLKILLAGSRVLPSGVEIEAQNSRELDELLSFCSKFNVSVYARPDLDATVNVQDFSESALHAHEGLGGMRCPYVARFVSVVHCRTFVRHLGYMFFIESA